MSLFALSQLPAPFVKYACTLATAQYTPTYQVHNAACPVDITHAMYTVASAQMGRPTPNWPDMPGPAEFGMRLLLTDLCKQLLQQCHSSGQGRQKKLEPFLDLCVSSLREGHANLLCIVPILRDVTEVTQCEPNFYVYIQWGP